jgi:hypothetical protein
MECYYLAEQAFAFTGIYQICIFITEDYGTIMKVTNRNIKNCFFVFQFVYFISAMIMFIQSYFEYSHLLSYIWLISSFLYILSYNCISLISFIRFSTIFLKNSRYKKILDISYVTVIIILYLYIFIVNFFVSVKQRDDLQWLIDNLNMALKVIDSSVIIMWILYITICIVDIISFTSLQVYIIYTKRKINDRSLNARNIIGILIPSLLRTSIMVITQVFMCLSLTGLGDNYLGYSIGLLGTLYIYRMLLNDSIRIQKIVSVTSSNKSNQSNQDSTK